MSKQWRCGVVGTGVIGELHMQVINAVPDMKLAAVCDRIPERGKALVDKLKFENVSCHADIAAMLKAEKLDIVHICTPSGDHMETALAALNAGVNVICEKPIEITLERIDRMIEASSKNKAWLACIFQNRWNPANRAIYDAARQNRFGRIAWAGCFTPWYRTDEYYRSGGWRGTWKLDGGGAMMNQSIHAVDLLQWIAGPIKSVSAYCGRRAHDSIEVEDTLSCSLQFQNGAFGTIMGTTAMFPGGHVRIEIGGENGSAVSEDGLKTFSFRGEKPDDAAALAKINQAKVDAGGATSQFITATLNHRMNVESILAAWNEGRDADTNGSEARKAVAIILAMYESAKKNGQPVQVG